MLEIHRGLIYPMKQIALSKTDVTITCFSEQKPHWSKDGVPLPDWNFLVHVNAKDNSLYISSVTFHDTGTYSCTGYNKTYFKEFSELLVAGIIICHVNAIN